MLSVVRLSAFPGTVSSTQRKNAICSGILSVTLPRIAIKSHCANGLRLSVNFVFLRAKGHLCAPLSNRFSNAKNRDFGTGKPAFNNLFVLDDKFPGRSVYFSSRSLFAAMKDTTMRRHATRNR